MRIVHKRKLLISWQSGEKIPSGDSETQKMLVDCILLLCQQRIIRNRLRALKVYPVIRNFDYEQENQEASDVIYEIVNLLVRDECVEEGHEVVDADRSQSNMSKTEEAGTAAANDNSKTTCVPEKDVKCVNAENEEFGSNELDEVD